MIKERLNIRDVSNLNINDGLKEQLHIVSSKCIKCKLCEKECAFLKKYGKPKDIADSYDPDNKFYQGLPFECSLCQLCAAVCPVKINPALMFLQMRAETVKRGNGEYPEHNTIIGYEKRGTSKRYTFYSLPESCDTVFFPGCTLSGTRPDKVKKLFDYMRKIIPSIGIVMDCCTKPSHDLGRLEYFDQMFSEMRDYLIANGIRNVIVACPNCYKVFKNYGKGLSVSTIYEFISTHGIPIGKKSNGEVSVHDSCAVRFEESIHLAVREILKNIGMNIVEMPHSKKKTVCCGEGGSVGFISQEFAKTWGLIRKSEADGKRLITYCAGCANFLGSLTPTSHIIDLIFDLEDSISGKAKVSKPPFTYINRLKLKKHFKKDVKGVLTREREFSLDKEKNKNLKRFALLSILIIAILAVRYLGLTSYFDKDRLHELLKGHSLIAPLIYMLIYTLAPSLFLPGLPITIVGGILFGPFWGVIYTITSATAGACLAFLISRYIARDWIEKKLKSPRWRKLDEAVERHGWKIVAFTRLIPLFPFNLLNYAFGLTKIKFSHYAIATFICMLPACIAFIVFSSSLLDLLRGKVSMKFIIGLGLILVVSLIPIIYNRYKSKKGIAGPL